MTRPDGVEIECIRCGHRTEPDDRPEEVGWCSACDASDPIGPLYRYAIPTVTDEASARRAIWVLVAILEMGFHPDTRAADYTNRDGSRTFDPAQCAAVDAALEGAARYLDDEYEAGLDCMRARGWIP